MDTIALAVAAASTTTIGLISAIAVGPAYPAVLLAKEAANRARWKDAGRTGAPRLVALAYYAFDDIDAGRANIHDYCSSAGEQFAGLMTGNISHGADGVRATMKAFEEIGADELIFSPAVSDPAEIGRLAEAVL